MSRTVTTAYLTEILRDARARTLELLQGLDETQIIGPELDIVNPILWEIGHVAWFYEYFILRRLYDYRPLLMVRWDDETDLGHRRPCDRDQVSRVRTERRRSVPVVIEVH